MTEWSPVCWVVVSILWYYNIIILWPISSVATLAFFVVPTYIRSWYTHVVLYCQTFRPGSWLFSTKLLTFWSHCHNLAVGIPSVYENWFFLFWRGRSIQGGRRFLHARALTPVDLSSFPRFTNLLPEKMGFLAIWNTFHAHQQQLISPKSSEAIPVLIGKSVWIPTSYEAITATVDLKKLIAPLLIWSEDAVFCYVAHRQNERRHKYNDIGTSSILHKMDFYTTN